MESYVQLAYLTAVVLLIVGLKNLSHPKTARKGNLLAAVGMGLAIVATLVMPLPGGDDNYWVIALGLVVGGGIGYFSALRVAMTAMPQLVSIFNGLGGACAVAIATIEATNGGMAAGLGPKLATMTALLVGGVAFTGSLIAYGKLQGIIKGSATIPAAPVVNGLLLLVSVGLGAWLVGWIGSADYLFYGFLALTLVYGVTFVLPIGGADMPVVISLLNALTGIAAALASYIYGNPMMLLGGVLVGASGTILTLLMVRAMNRSLVSVLIGGFGSSSSAAVGDADRTVREVTPTDAAILLRYAKQVVFVPGYGMAVAQAQKTIHELEQRLVAEGVDVKYAIHPVAGRMPGHMNVLLAEADVSYDNLLDLDDANATLADTDVAVIVGANDVVNPSAKDDPGSPIYGMPILEVLQAQNVIVLKRSMAAGYSGLENPLFFHKKNQMLFGDAKASLGAVQDELKNLG